MVHNTSISDNMKKVILNSFKVLGVIGLVSLLVYVELNDITEYRTMKMEIVKFKVGSKIIIKTDTEKHLCKIFRRTEENGKVSLVGFSDEGKNFGFGLTFDSDGLIAGSAADYTKNLKYSLTLDTISGTFFFRNCGELKQP